MPDHPNQPRTVAALLDAALVAWREAPTPQAFNTLMKLVYQHALACLQRLEPANADAQDLAQDTARAILRHLETNDGPGSLAAYVKVTARNRYFDRRRRMRWLDCVGDLSAPGDNRPWLEPADAAWQEDVVFARTLMAFAAKMPPALREVFEQTMVDGHSPHQLATIRAQVADQGRAQVADQGRAQTSGQGLAYQATYDRELARLDTLRRRIRQWLREHVADLPGATPMHECNPAMNPTLGGKAAR